MASVRQRRVLKIRDNQGKTMRQAMIDAGYSESYARNPQDLQRTESWQNLMQTCFPDELLAKQHRELLIKKEVVVKSYEGENEIVKTGEIDVMAVRTGLDMAYKLKGKYAPREFKITDETTLDEYDKRDRELAEEESRVLAELQRIKVGKNKKRPRTRQSKKGSQETKEARSDILPEPEVGGVHQDGGAEQ